MSRDRHQRGFVEETGKRVKKWKGHYFIYVKNEDGTERRIHKAPILGLKSEMKKWEAQRKLEAIIDQKTESVSVKASPEFTLKWFWENRFKPAKEPTWKESSRKETIANIDRYVIRKFGDKKLSEIDKFLIQTTLNELAKTYSRSVVEKCLIWSRAILEEAIDLDFISKNPAAKVVLPECRKVNKSTLAAKEIAQLLAALPARERIVTRIALVLGLRPGEILALRWSDIQGFSLRVDESARHGKIVTPKSDASDAYVWLPVSIKNELDAWREFAGDCDPDSLIFPNADGGAYRLDNYRSRHLKKATDAIKLKNVTFQAMRRTCGTFMNQKTKANIKDVQAHLRHARASTTMDEYVQEVPESVRKAVELLDSTLTAEIEAETNSTVN